MKQKDTLIDKRPKNNALLLKKSTIITLLLLSPFFHIYSQCNTLVWSDEFDGTTVDASKWQNISGNGCPELCGFGNAEAQRYQPSNASIIKEGSNSYLSMEAKYEPNASFPNQPYSGVKLSTEGKYSVKYGRIEARMKLSSATGAWPAFWMLPDGGNWPYTGEIDIMEGKHKNPTSVGGTIHYDSSGHQYSTRDYSSITNLSQDFHIYAVEWSTNTIKWFIDDTLFYTMTSATTVGKSWPFNDKNFFIILNLAVGSAGTPFTGGVAPIPSEFPTKLLVDYVRVYSGSFTYGVTGNAKVYNNDTNKTYTINSIAGASYNWSVPTGAKIVSGQGTNTIVVNWGTTGGDVSVITSVSGCADETYKMAVTTEAPLQIEKIYEDFELNRNVVYGLMTGSLSQAIANPSATGLNTSTLVGKYVRNASETYDVMNVKNITINNANDFVSGRKKIAFDIYTSAPIGTKVTMQLENSLVTTADNYPIGRHSSYTAVTTVQNKWETIEFEFEKTIDANTTGMSINNVVFLFESGLKTGSTYYFDNLLVKAGSEKPVLNTNILENYDGISKIIKGTTTGTYTPNTANPSSTGVNTSVNVAKYKRNTSELYDVLFFNTQNNIEDAGLLKNQVNKIVIDVYTAAPIGTLVTLNLENSLNSLPGNYPTGRNSTYIAQTTKQNQWETLTFYFSSTPDANTSNFSVNQMVLLFNSGSNTSDTYYFDNVRIESTKSADNFVTGDVYEDYESIHNITFSNAIGTYTPNTPNPSADGTNTSPKVGKYIRKSSESYDNMSFKANSINIATFKNGTTKFAMDVYTSAPVGSLISWQVESEASIPTNYPTGRHSIYQAVVKETNTWHTLVFSYASSPDAATLDADVSRFVFLFEPGTNSGNTYYFDNLRSLTSGTLSNNDVEFIPEENLKLYPNPTKDFLKITFAKNDNKKEIAVYDLTGKIVLQKNTISQDDSVDVRSLSKGLYIIKVKLNEKMWIKKFIKE